MIVLGLWFSVTAITILLLLPFIMLLPLVVQHFVGTITGDTTIATECQEKIISRDFCDYLVFFGVVNVHVCILALLGVASAGLYIGILVRVVDFGKTAVGVVSDISIVTAPFASWIAVAVIVYTISIYAGRKMFKLSQKINAALDKEQ